MSKKVGRNDPCPCGSGIKYKKCHGATTATPLSAIPEGMKTEIEKLLRLKQTQEIQRQQQQGFGKPIISTLSNGIRFIAVGDKIFRSAKWKSFHDFLQDYIKSLIDNRWADNELKKPHTERHPLMIWYEMTVRHNNQHLREPGTVVTIPITGAGAAYLGLAYNLYLVAHNVKVQETLLKRLVKKDQFYGAFYEAFVVGILIRAGFEIEFEDETDSTTSHCELTATFPKTGKKFSVEAKMRGPNKKSADVGNQLYAALKKRAQHTRIVFIEVNMPDDCNDEKATVNLRQALNGIRGREQTLMIDGQPAPPAYVFVTNNPHEYSLNGPYQSAGLVEGFKIPDFKFEAQFKSIREARINREEHLEVISVFRAMGYGQIPATFDGDNPDLAFGGVTGRLQIGKRYIIPDAQGREIIGELLDACVMESQKLVFCIYRLASGEQIIGQEPMNDAELTAFRKHPDTYFGVVKKGARGGIQDPLEFYDYCFDIYKQTPKERLIELLGVRGLQKFEGLSQSELAELHCERLATSVFLMATATRPKTQ